MAITIGLGIALVGSMLISTFWHMKYVALHKRHRETLENYKSALIRLTQSHKRRLLTLELFRNDLEIKALTKEMARHHVEKNFEEQVATEGKIRALVQTQTNILEALTDSHE